MRFNFNDSEELIYIYIYICIYIDIYILYIYVASPLQLYVYTSMVLSNFFEAKTESYKHIPISVLKLGQVLTFSTKERKKDFQSEFVIFCCS